MTLDLIEKGLLGFFLLLEPETPDTRALEKIREFFLQKTDKCISNNSV